MKISLKSHNFLWFFELFWFFTLFYCYFVIEYLKHMNIYLGDIMKKIIVLGGGASGVLASILLAKKHGGDNVLLIEGNDRILKKLALTGNGQCNLTNKNMTKDKFFGDKSFIESVLNRCDDRHTLELFSQLGISTVQKDNGKIFPRSYQASSVADILRLHLDILGVEVLTSEQITRINVDELDSNTNAPLKFEVVTAQNRYTCEKLVYALGGATYPKLLTCESNFVFLKNLGHSVKPLAPALVHLRAKNKSLHMLKGIKVDVSMSLISNGKILASDSGEVHFGDGVLSGPVSFQLSPFASNCLLNNVDVTASIDFFSEYTSGGLLEYFCDRAELLENFSLENFFSTLVHNQIGRAIIKEAGLNNAMSMKDVTDNDLINLMKVSKGFTSKIVDTNGYSFAQVSLGGIPTSEITENFQSKLIPNLYILGETLDVTGSCGGYNLQWAWSSAQLASLEI